MVRFDLPLEVTFDSNGSPVYKGPYVQGPRQAPFVYLVWGDRVAGAWRTARRAKFPLSALPRPLVERAVRTGAPIRVRIRMAWENGEPVAATIKPEMYEVEPRSMV
jgi:hypothetical protein